MNLLATTLQRSSAINAAVYGNFSAPKQQEILVARGSYIELLRPDETGKVISVSTTPVFANVRSILPFRLSGANKDYAVIGSDSGKISIIEFDAAANDWRVVHCEVFGRSGCRRIVPGQYLATDPKGRAILVGGIEKQKFVYVTNRDSANRLTISSPLEAHKSETILFSVVGIDVGFDNPIFAMIELEYTEADQDPSGEAAQEVEKKLTYYEVDLGLNHVVRKWSEPISRTANFLLAVPGGDAWPGGVLVCGENWVSYKHQGHTEVRAPLPRRHDLPVGRGVLITTGTVHKQKDLFFCLIQSEYGDLYKVTLEQDPSDPKIVKNVVVAVFDSIQPCVSLCITKTGLLFGASEIGNHSLFQFQGIDDPTAIRSGCIEDDELNEELGDDSVSAARIAPLFKVNAKLQNLLLTDDVNSLAPATDMLVADLAGEGTAQIYVACGKGHNSSLRTLRNGVSFTEMAVSELPGRPVAVWTVKKNIDDEFDRYIVVSFSNATLVLSIGENVEEVTDSGFLTSSPTLQVALLADNALIQVHNLGIRHIRTDGRVSEWKTPGRRNIQMATVNTRQVAVALSGGDVVYFELDAAGTLVEMGTIDMGKEISSLDLGVVPDGRARTMFLAIGSWDDSVQLLSLDPSDVLAKGPSFQVESRPTSLCFVEMKKNDDMMDGQGAGTVIGGNSSTSAETVLYLNVGLEKGVLFRVSVDPVTGDFSDARQRYLGPKAVKLCRVSVQGQPGLLALTAQSWLMYNYQKRMYQDPVSYEPLEFASNFSSDACPDGIVAVLGSTLRVLTIDNLGQVFNQQSMPLRHTPRKLCQVPGTHNLVLIETDHNEYSEAEKKEMSMAADLAMSGASASAGSGAMECVEAAASGAAGGNEGQDDDEEEEVTIMRVRGPVPPSVGQWASCIRIVDTISKSTVCLHELPDNEAAFSMCMCNFRQHSAEIFLVVGSVRGFVQSPRSFTGCFVTVYRMLEGTLQLLHQTEVEDIPACMIEFQGKLLVGIGRSLRLYDMGKRKLLKKCENKGFPTMIMKLQASGDRIYVGDLTESVHFVKYNTANNVLSIFADDTLPRFITCMCVLDYATVACGDKFGNVFVLRLPDDASDEVISGPGGARGWYDRGLLNGAPNKLEVLNHFYLGEIPTHISKATLKAGGKDMLLVGTIMGGLHAFMRVRTKEESNFFQHLEMYMRQEFGTLCQRDHLSYRSYYQPVKSVVDAELCSCYAALSLSKQRDFAESIDRSPTDIFKKLEEMREFL